MGSGSILHLEFDDATPAPPSGKANVKWQKSGQLASELCVSAYLPDMVGDSGSGGTGGGVPKPNAGDFAAGKFLSAGGTWAVPSGSGASLLGLLTPATITPPVLSGFTWGNQDGATAVANAGGGLFLSRSSGVNANDINMLYKAPPAPPWSLVVGFVPTLGTNGYNLAGIALRESGTGKIVAMFSEGDRDSTGATSFVIGTYANYNTFHLTYINPNPYPAGIVWMRVQDDNAGNYIFSLGPDGQNWLTALTKSKTDYFTAGADQIGFAINVNPPGGALFVHWAGI